MLLRFLVLAIFSGTALFAQQKTLRFIDGASSSPVIDADVYTDLTFVTTTNYNGNIKIDITGNYTHLTIDHVAYEKRTIPRDSLLIKKVYKLKKRVGVLDEVVVDKELQIDSTANRHANFSYGMKAATLIIPPANSYVTKLKFRVINTLGVKGLNFLPFKANIYALDSVTHLPGKPLLPQEVVVENKNGDDWAVVDVSAYKLKLPPQGACVVFIIPLYEEGLYKTFWIQSTEGLISAVPMLDSERAPITSKSYLYTGHLDDLLAKIPGSRWKPLHKWRYRITAEFTKDGAQH